MLPIGVLCLRIPLATSCRIPSALEILSRVVVPAVLSFVLRAQPLPIGEAEVFILWYRQWEHSQVEGKKRSALKAQVPFPRGLYFHCSRTSLKARCSIDLANLVWLTWFSSEQECSGFLNTGLGYSISRWVHGGLKLLRRLAMVACTSNLVPLITHLWMSILLVRNSGCAWPAILTSLPQKALLSLEGVKCRVKEYPGRFTGTV
jgi:hypothetical protein